MAVFSKSPAKQLADAQAARDRLTEQLRDAEIAVNDLRKEAARLAVLGATEEALSAAEARTREKVDRVTTLQSALTQSKATVADLERERDQAADAALRDKTSTETEALARRMHEGCAKLVADAAALADWSTRSAAVVPESGGLVHLCAVIGNEIPAASDLIAKLLRVHAQAVLDGRAAASLPEPMQPYVQPPVNKPATVQIFSLHALRWIDHEGTVRVSGKWRDCELPPALAEKAIRLKLAAPMSDPRRQKLVGQSPGHPEPAWLNDLNAEVGPNIATQSAAEPVLHSAFGKPVIGPAKIMQIATTRS
jgi:hypothetical protein